MTRLLQDANSDSEIIDWNGSNYGSLQIFGTWDGCIVTIKGSLDDGENFTACQGAVLTSDVITSFLMAPGKVKAFLTNVGVSTSLTCELSPG